MSGSPTPRETADLLARARALIEAGSNADPADTAAFLAAKADLLARITDTHTDHTSGRTDD